MRNDEKVEEIATPVAAEDGDLEEGGWPAWKALIGCWLISYVAFGTVNSFSVIQTYLLSHQLANEPPANVSLVGSIQYALLLLSGLFVGRLFDRGYLHHLMIVGTVATVLAIEMLSLCEKLWQVVLSYGILAGIGLGCLYVPSVACLTQYWPPKRRLFIVGVSATGSSIGGVCVPIILERLFPRIGCASSLRGLLTYADGWTIRTFGFIELVVCIAGSLCLKARFVGRNHGRLFDLSPYRQPAYALLVAGVLSATLGLYLPIFYASSYAVHIGIDTQLAFYCVAIISGASFFGRLLPPLASDRLGAIVVLTPTTFLAGVMACMLPLVQSTAGAIVYFVAYGFLSGAYVAIVSAAAVAITEPKDLPRLGHRQGLLFATSAPGALAVGPICGQLISAAGGRYFGAAVYAGSVTIIGSVLIGLAGVVHSRRIR